MSGLGGVGKTALAIVFAHEYKDAYSDGVFHLNSESQASLQNSLKRAVCVIVCVMSIY